MVAKVITNFSVSNLFFFFTLQEKTHECPECQRTFRHKGNLIRHMALHDPESTEQVMIKLFSLKCLFFIFKVFWEWKLILEMGLKTHLFSNLWSFAVHSTFYFSKFCDVDVFPKQFVVWTVLIDYFWQLPISNDCLHFFIVIEILRKLSWLSRKMTKRSDN